MENIYFNFPICLLKSIRNEGVRGMCNNIINFCFFEKTLVFEGTIEQKMAAANEYYCLDLSYKDWNHGKYIYDLIPKNTPRAGLNKNILFDFSQNFKSTFEEDSLIGFCAIRSILQKKMYARITKKLVVARMSGNASTKEIIGNESTNRFAKYLVRYHFDKLKLELYNNWGLKIYSNHTNGLYVSFKLSRLELGEKAELNKKKNKEILQSAKIRIENKNIQENVKLILKQKINGFGSN